MPFDCRNRPASSGAPDALHDLMTAVQELGRVADGLGRCARARADGDDDLPGGVETLLLIDDNAVVRSVAQDWLAQFGYRVISSEAGRAALATYRRQRPAIDLVLLDLPPRRHHRRATLAALRRIDPCTRVVVCAALPGGPAAAELRAWGAAGIIAKPLRRAELARAVRRALDARP